MSDQQQKDEQLRRLILEAQQTVAAKERQLSHEAMQQEEAKRREFQEELNRRVEPNVRALLSLKAVRDGHGFKGQITTGYGTFSLVQNGKRWTLTRDNPGHLALAPQHIPDFDDGDQQAFTAYLLVAYGKLAI